MIGWRGCCTRSLLRHNADRCLISSRIWDADELYALLYAYCRYGPIGLIEAIPSHLPPLIDERIQELADFHRLGKHPRSDPGVFIREVLARYTSELGISPLPDFVARYAYATDRRITRWYIGDSITTQRVSKTTRRLNRNHSYLHQRWCSGASKLPLHCFLSQRHAELIEPWLIWIYEELTTKLMGFRLCPTKPTTSDYLCTLRWAIWHFDAPLWKARGIPDQLVVPSAAGSLSDHAQRALDYLQTEIKPKDKDVACSTEGFIGFPDGFADWLNGLNQIYPTPHNYTLATLQSQILEYVQDFAEDKTFAQSTTYYSFENAVPFIKTEQYRKFHAVCNYVRRRRKMALVWGEAGTGKTSAAHQFVKSLPINPANNHPPALYIELEQSDKTDRALYNVLISAILDQPAGNLLAKPAGEEAKRLITKCRYDTIIIDEFGFLQDSGLEAVRTLWDKLQICMIFITMPDRIAKLQQPKYKQLYSRLARIERFDGLTQKQIMEDLLPRIAQQSYFSFETDQEDAVMIVKELYALTNGNFRQIMRVLDQANEIVFLSQQKRDKMIAEGKDTSQCKELPVFEVSLIQAAAAATKDLPDNKVISQGV